jgi:hypothetical protein
MNQANAWANVGNRQELEQEHDGREPEEDCDPGSEGEPSHYAWEARAHIHEAHEQARKALRRLLDRLKQARFNPDSGRGRAQSS